MRKLKVLMAIFAIALLPTVVSATESLVSERSSALFMDADGILRDFANVRLRGQVEPGAVVSPLCEAGNTATLTVSRGTWVVQSTDLPCEGWKGSGSSYRYRARKTAPGGVKSVRIRKNRRGATNLSIVVGGQGHVSPADIYLESVQVTLSIGEDSFCGRFEDPTRRTEIGFTTRVQFRGSSNCFKIPEVTVRQAIDPATKQVVAGQSNVLVQSLELTGDPDIDVNVTQASLELYGIPTNVSNLTAWVNAGILETHPTPSGFNGFFSWSGISVPAGTQTWIDFTIDTWPGNAGFSVQAASPPYAVTACSTDYNWCTSEPESGYLYGPVIEVMPHGLLFMENVGVGNVRQVNVTTYLEPYFVRRVSFGGVGCEGTQVAVVPADPSQQPYIAPYEWPFEIGLLNTWAIPGVKTPVVQVISEPGCTLGISYATGTGAYSAHPRYAGGCPNGVCPETIPVVRWCDDGQCHDCPQWYTGEPSSSSCIPFP